VGVGPLGHFGELGDDVRWCGPVGVAHAHVDDVFAPAAGGEFELGRDVEDVGGEAINARKAALALRSRHAGELSRKRPEPSERRGRQKGRPEFNVTHTHRTSQAPITAL